MWEQLIQPPWAFKFGPHCPQLPPRAGPETQVSQRPADLGEVPQPLRGPGHIFALLQGGRAAPAVIHQALGVRQESGGAQGAQLQQALGAVPHQLGRGHESGVHGHKAALRRAGPQALKGVGGASWAGHHGRSVVGGVNPVTRANLPRRALSAGMQGRPCLVALRPQPRSFC